jgi:hypothetical protein
LSLREGDFDVSQWPEMGLGVVLGLLVVGSLFGFTFRRMPERRSDGGLTQHDASYYTSGDDGGHHSA